ncbi:hypothetical protein SAMN05216371_0128 [Streptomyces sp. TLI_053]|uniref:terpene synthase family protein n=1 Tax=Streptomyces sp. TLI_053 TaxID=1855352 RepID=UPI00087D1D62|nr:hypothetical protein [Streptomyces sp. TLI_053]SDS54232.1 hypothetical protein SAMN05216371_0128 [Streptomyces sp. TLI_053]
MMSDLPPHLLTFYCPFKSELSPDNDLLSQGTRAWVRRFGFGDAAHADTGAAMTAHFFPRVTGELAQALADYSAWAFVVNDHAVPEPGTAATCDVVDDMNRWARVMRSIDTYGAYGTPLEAALRDSLLRIRARTTPLQFERFVNAQSTWLWQMTWETALREKQKQLGVNDYLAMRVGAVGVYATHGCIDAVAGIETPDGELARSCVRAACEAGAFASALDNDRYSLLRESQPGKAKYNLFKAMRHDNPYLSEAESIVEGVRLRDRIMSLYVRLRDKILTDASEDLARYFATLDLVIGGNVRFGTSATRYVTPRNAPRPVVLTAPPAELSSEPAPYPTIAWWWDQLG